MRLTARFDHCRLEKRRNVFGNVFGNVLETFLKRFLNVLETLSCCSLLKIRNERLEAAPKRQAFRRSVGPGEHRNGEDGQDGMAKPFRRSQPFLLG
jgi:hypothetical protein